MSGDKAVRAERPSSVHLDRGMATMLRHIAMCMREGVQAHPNRAGQLSHIADAIEASLAPQTPEAKPVEKIYHHAVNGKSGCGVPLVRGNSMPELNHVNCDACLRAWHGGTLPTRFGEDSPVSLAPVDGRPDVEGMKALEAEATKGPWTASLDNGVSHGPDGYWLIYDVGGIDSSGVVTVADFAFIAACRRYVPESVAYISRLEADLSRLTLEYRVHMRNITEGEAARKAEVAALKAEVSRLKAKE